MLLPYPQPSGNGPPHPSSGWAHCPAPTGAGWDVARPTGPWQWEGGFLLQRLLCDTSLHPEGTESMGFNYTPKRSPFFDANTLKVKGQYGDEKKNHCGMRAF